jgi:glycosyltransferase involved in cell wall biosynthesis
VARQLSDPFALNQSIKLLSVIVAVYNEENTIAETMHELRKVLDSLPFANEILVVESNSKDNTRKILSSISEKLKLTLFFQENPEGKGSAVRLGMRKMSGDVFLIYDGDAEYDPEDIPKLLIPISNGTTSFVLGTRHEKGKAMRKMHDHRIRPFLMNLAHKFFTYLLNIFFGVKLTDPFTMYKVFRTGVFNNVELVSNRFDFDWELVAKAIRRGACPLEIPVTYNSRSFSEGKKVRFFRDPMTWLVALLRFRFCRI